MSVAGLPVVSGYVLEGSYEAASGYNRAHALLAMPSPPTAIFAANDTLAIATIDAARDLGVRVPEDLSVIGFDDIPVAALGYVGLTTIRQPLTEIGRVGAQMLIDLLDDRNREPRRRLFSPELICRHTTARLGV
jgi:LacI family transcriptional regulator